MAHNLHCSSKKRPSCGILRKVPVQDDRWAERWPGGLDNSRDGACVRSPLRLVSSTRTRHSFLGRGGPEKGMKGEGELLVRRAEGETDGAGDEGGRQLLKSENNYGKSEINAGGQCREGKKKKKCPEL